MTTQRATHIADEWAQYAERVLPATAGEIQRTETRRAFYAGATMILGRISRSVSDDEEATPEDEQIIDDISTEIEAFMSDVLAGRA